MTVSSCFSGGAMTVHWGSVWLWVGFSLFILAMLAVDLGVFHRRARAVKAGEAAAWSAVWVGLALVFAVLVYAWQGPVTALEFLTGYLIEKALSVDNVFVFFVIFAYFRVPAAYQHRVLFWGILGALVMRAAFILAGAALIAGFAWTFYVFGGFLVVTGVKMWTTGTDGVHPEANPLVKLFRKMMPVTGDYEGERFFVRRNGAVMATPLFLVLLVVETTDVVFAVDSIPAIFGVTRDPFIVYTSNVFAILGLRAMYFLLAGVVHRLRYLRHGLSVILVFIGVKMFLCDVYHVPVGVSLFVVFTVLAVTVAASLASRGAGRGGGGGARSRGRACVRVDRGPR